MTEETFPSILSFSRVIERHEVELTPIENAIVNIERKNEELRDIYTSLSDPTSSASINGLTMALNGVIDAEVNGGIKKYQEAFFSPEFLQENPNNENNIIRIKQALRESIEIVEKALILHRSRCPANLQKLQEKLDVFYERMKQQIESLLSQ